MPHSSRRHVFSMIITTNPTFRRNKSNKSYPMGQNSKGQKIHYWSLPSYIQWNIAIKWMKKWWCSSVVPAKAEYSWLACWCWRETLRLGRLLPWNGECDLFLDHYIDCIKQEFIKIFKKAGRKVLKNEKN